MLSPQPAPVPPANKITFNDLMQTARDLGTEAGKGTDTQIRFLLSLADGAYHGALDLTPNKHGTNVDDAEKITEEYVRAKQKSTIWDAKAANQRVAISKSRTLIKVGGWTKGGNGEPIATINNLMTIWQKLRKTPAEAKKLDDAANTLLSYARAQLKSDTLLSDDRLREFCYKKVPDPQSAEQIIENMTKQLDRLIDGKAASGTAQDNSPEIINARQSLRNRLSAIATARGKAQGPNPLGKLVK